MCSRYGKPACRVFARFAALPGNRLGRPVGGGREEAIPVPASIAAKEDGYQDSGEQTERQENKQDIFFVHYRSVGDAVESVLPQGLF
jgi:hypothetical protein